MDGDSNVEKKETENSMRAYAAAATAAVVVVAASK